MASKKYILLAGVFCLLVSSAFSQAKIRAYEDSSVIPAKRMPQHTEFLNGTYNFPAKPRNQWEVGVKGGLSSISGSVRARIPTFGLGVHARKAFGYVFSMRLEYDYLTAKGLNFSGSQAYYRNKVLMSIYNPSLNPANQQIIFYNYKTTISDLSLHGIVTLNNIRFHKAKTGINLYGFGGIGGMIYDAKYDALDRNGRPYNYSNIVSANYKTRKATLKALKAMLDGNYETTAERDNLQPKLFDKPFKPSFSVGVGAQFKLSNRFNIALEDKFTSVRTRLLTGNQWQENWDPRAPGAVAQIGQWEAYNFLSLGLNVNLGAKAVEPLWWLNPLDYAYSEIRNPKLMKIPKPILPDSDGDGVTDQFDLEPNTPAGCPVDTHGVSRDTDGDGVPDCKDKELITPTICQPVDADGVGKCPCPDSSCFEKYIKKTETTCTDKLGALPSVHFEGKTVSLSTDAKSLLASVASRLRNNPECKVVVVGYCNSTKQEQQLSWDRVNSVINYLVEKEGISADRFIFQYGQEGGDCGTVDLRAAAAGEQGPNTVPAPHPNLKRNK